MQVIGAALDCRVHVNALVVGFSALRGADDLDFFKGVEVVVVSALDDSIDDHFGVPGPSISLEAAVGRRADGGSTDIIESRVHSRQRLKQPVQAVGTGNVFENGLIDVDGHVGLLQVDRRCLPGNGDGFGERGHVEGHVDGDGSADTHVEFVVYDGLEARQFDLHPVEAGYELRGTESALFVCKFDAVSGRQRRA